MANETSNGVQYSVLFVNNSSQTGSACIYQQDPDITDPAVVSLAWFAKAAAPTTNVSFSWSIDYNFVWSETGNLIPGVVFRASQTWGANLTTTNKVTFLNSGQAYTFADQQAGPRPGSLYITEDASLPVAMSSVGIGMSGFGTFATPTQPNNNLIFTPHPQYWIAFGRFQQGEVMDITSVNNPAQIEFPPNVYSMTALLNADNTWNIMPTSQANALFAAAKAQNPELAFGHPSMLLAGPRG